MGNPKADYRNLGQGLRVYVAGPVNGSGKQNGNAARALEVARLLRAHGFVPFVPHLYWIWSLLQPNEDESYWLSMCDSWVRACDILVRLPGVSPGSDREEEWAKECGIPVFKCDGDIGDHLTPARLLIAHAVRHFGYREMQPKARQSTLPLPVAGRTHGIDYSAFSTFQADVKHWLVQQPFYPQAPHQPLLGALEELGELAHAHLKNEQNIRGTAEKHLESKKDAVGDVIVYLAGYCEANDLDLGVCLERAWEEVRQRDWNKNRENGAPIKPLAPPARAERLTGADRHQPSPYSDMSPKSADVFPVRSQGDGDAD